MFSNMRSDSVSFWLLFNCFLLLSANVVDAAPLRVRQTPAQATQFTTVHTTMTPMGLVTETCVVVFNPVKDAQGKDVIQEVKTCTLSVGADPKAPPPQAPVPPPPPGTSSTGATSATATATSAIITASPTDTLISVPSTYSQSPPAITTAVSMTGLPPAATLSSSTESASATLSASATIPTDSASATVTGTDATSTQPPVATDGGIVVIGTSSTSVGIDSAAPTATPTASSTDSATGAPSNPAATTASSSPNAGGNGIVVVGTSSASPANPTDFPSGTAPAATTGTADGAPAVTSSAADNAVTDTSPAPSGSAAAQETPTAAAFTLPGKQLSVLPIGLGVFAGISVIALIVVGLVTYERTKYRKAFRQRKLAEAGAPMGYGGNMA